MPNIAALDITNAGEAQPILDGVKKEIGMVPNLLATMANSPAALNAYLGFSGALSEGMLSPALREQLALAVAGTNECDYCASAHTLIAKGAGVSAEEAALNLSGKSTDPRVNSILNFARRIVETRGHPDDAALQELRDADISDGEIVEIIAHVGVNIFTNYFNHIAGTDIDFPHVNTAVRQAAE